MDDLIKKYQKHISSAFGAGCNKFNALLREFENKQNVYCSKCNKCDYKNTHLYGCFESVRWDNKYIYYCPCGFIFVAVPLFDEQDALTDGIILGPVLMGEAEDFDEHPDIPNMSTSKVNDMTEIASGVFAPKLKNIRAKESTNDFLNTIYKELENLGEGYPIDIEKQLQKSIVDRDGEYARALLNKYLGQIFFYSNGDFKIIKARALELVVLLSRAAIEGGADVRQVFNLNNNYISEVESFDTLEQLSSWLSGVINRFISYVFEFGDAKHADTIYKVTAYIKNNYMNKISLDEIADYVYLSKSYLSKIFNSEMGMTISNYMNKIRIEKSKILLCDNSLSIADVANLTGFEDQSYFTKIFKNITGISPGQYKNKGDKI